MPIYGLGQCIPQIHESAYVSDNATVIGHVTLAPLSSVWSHAVLRADNDPIEIGKCSNVQEGAVLHCDPGFPLKVGANVTVGHQPCCTAVRLEKVL
jgi:carbonic anhydrase/acetyltransferase-like protein (isoleucine patch superfamily)